MAKDSKIHANSFHLKLKIGIYLGFGICYLEFVMQAPWNSSIASPDWASSLMKD